ncbi:MAG: hypothetical protein EOO38_11205 [Cytophagaceae bacterium]|nr:MAG: hypothetical protein EOO38_11205 [Cytophagaceae bacterium]
MIILITGYLAAIVAPTAATSVTICDVGRVALHDLPVVACDLKYDTYYAGEGRSQQDILSICPKLQNEIPAEYRLSDDDARKRANVGAPIPGQFTKPAFIYSISVADLSADQTTATVHFDVSCTGLCGGRSEARYVRTSRGWQRQGEVRTLFVS